MSGRPNRGEIARLAPPSASIATPQPSAPVNPSGVRQYDDEPQKAARPSVQGPRTGAPAAGRRHVPPPEMGGHDRHAGDLLHHAVDTLGPRTLCARSGRAGRSGEPAVLHVRHRDLAAGILLRGRPAHHGRDRPVSRDHRRGPGMVRLCLPADRVDRSVPACRTLRRRRPQCPHPAGQRAAGAARSQKGVRPHRSGSSSRSGPAAHGSSISPMPPRCGRFPERRGRRSSPMRPWRS